MQFGDRKKIEEVSRGGERVVGSIMTELPQGVTFMPYPSYKSRYALGGGFRRYLEFSMADQAIM